MSRTPADTPPEDTLSSEWSLEPSSGEQGDITIGDNVIAQIVARACSEVAGVVIDSRFALADLIGRKEKEHIKGIAVERDETENSVLITCSVRMKYGEDLYRLAVRLRDHVRTTVEKMTHVIVRRVDIRIVGIILDRGPGNGADEETRAHAS